MIVNFDEYIETLRELFAQRQKSEIDAYAQDILTSGQKQKKAKEKLQKEISLITAKIKQLREEISQTKDKKAISPQIKRLKKTKRELIAKLKKREQTSRFSVLSAESKTALCTLTVLRKYLTKEILENEFLQMNKDNDGNIIFNRDYFVRSSLFDDVAHVYDYIAVYLQKNPELVTSESYFNKLFDKESGWRGICRKADDFFEKLNKEKRKKSRAELIAESRSDLELIKEYPSENLILVRLKTPEALDYEGSAAHNCVGGGGYDKLIHQNNSGIFSLRHLQSNGELKPVVTIELNEGQIKQVRGICNSSVAYSYSLPSRDAVMMLLNKQSQAELINDKTVSENILNSCGLFRDGKGGFLDIHNLTGTEDFELPELRIFVDGLKDYDWEKLKIKDVRILGKLQDSEICRYLENLTNAQTITIEDLSTPLNLDLDKFCRLQKLSISSTDGTTCNLQGKKSVLPELSLSKVILEHAKDFRLKSFICSIEENSVLDISDFPQLEELKINAKKDSICSLKGQSRTLSSLTAGKLNFLNAEKDSFPSLETLKCTYVGKNMFPLLAFPGLKDACLFFSDESGFCLEGKHENLATLKACHLVINDFSAPNLQRLECSLEQQQNLDISDFPKLEWFSCLSTKTGVCLPLKKTANKLTYLNLGKVRFENMSMRQFPVLNELCLKEVDLRQTNLKLPDTAQTTFEDCIFDGTSVQNLYPNISSMEKKNYRNKVMGTHFDLSRYSEYLNLSGLHFCEAEVIKFAPKIKTLQLDVQIPSSTRIEGLNEVESLIFYENKENASLIEKINPKLLKKLKYDNLTLFRASKLDILRYTNLQELSGSGFTIDEIPESVERLNIIAVFNGNEIGAYDSWDFSRLTNLKEVDIRAYANTKHIIFPQNVEKARVGDVFINLETLDFSNCHKLNNLTLALVAPNIKKVSLPDSLKVLEAFQCESGIGIHSTGFAENKNLRIEIPSTARPEIIGYLRKQWGDKRIRVISPKKKQIAPVLLLQNANKRLK